jgi:hypothetical protein
MPRRYGWLVLLSVVVVVASGYAGWMIFQPLPQLPFTVRWVDAQHARIEPIPGLTSPTVHAGDRLLLAAQKRATRIALVTSEATNLPSSASYPLVIERGAAQVEVTVRAVDGNTGALSSWADWLTLYSVILFAGIALLALWRGHDRAAWGMALWAMAAGPLAFASADAFAPYGNGLALLGVMGFYGFNLLARIGFYGMAESIAGSVLSPRRRALWRGLFALVLGAAAIRQLGGPIAVVAAGWAGLMQPWWGLLLLVAYLVPIALLIASYRHADDRGRQRLRWLLWGSVVFVAGLIPIDLPLPLSNLVSEMLNSGFITLGAAAMLYAVLRHRVVDVSVVLDHTLVYGGLTALVVGVLAAVNSLVQHAALGTNASLLLQVIVPLALGIVLGQVRNYANKFVEQVFFRKKYLAEKALRRFARYCTGYENTQELLAAAAQIIHEKLGTPGVALYLRKDGQYAAAAQQGDIAYPKSVNTDDGALAAARSGQKDIDLSELHSALGSDGYVFPMGTQAVLVCANRPGEHYAADERKLLAQVARQMGGALLAINARKDRDFIRSAARGVLDPDSIRAQALRLETGWMEN